MYDPRRSLEILFQSAIQAVAYFTCTYNTVFTVRTSALISVRNAMFDQTKNLDNCFKNSIYYNSLPVFLFNRIQGFKDKNKPCGHNESKPLVTAIIFKIPFSRVCRKQIKLQNTKLEKN